MSARRWILWGLVALMAQRAWHYLPMLPDRVASHFSGGGVADGWSSKTSFVVTLIGVGLLMALIGEGTSLLIRVLPAGMINVPHREYWLAPERKEETLRDLRTRILEMMILTLVFMLFLFEITLRANLETEPVLPSSFLVSLLIYLAAVFALTVRMVVPYLRVPR